jgi:hypothetical protein
VVTFCVTPRRKLRRPKRLLQVYSKDCTGAVFGQRLFFVCLDVETVTGALVRAGPERELGGLFEQNVAVEDVRSEQWRELRLILPQPYPLAFGRQEMPTGL